MPHEERRIIFDYNEAYNAIYALCSEKKVQKPPVGGMLEIQFSYDNPFELKILFEDHKTNLEHRMVLTKDFVIAALMMQCRNIGIPLPKGANKTLELAKDGKVILHVQIIR